MPLNASARRLIDEARSRYLEGSDLTSFGDRISIAPLPWSFEEIVSSHAQRSPDLLDLETGGGEWLAALSFRPARTVATESWPPNVDVAGARLRPLGIIVVHHEAARENVDQDPGEERGRLPFPPESFALITNRHATFLAEEVARVLTRGGTFLTQQVGGRYDDFYGALGLDRPAPRPRRWNLSLARAQLAAAGLDVVESGHAEEFTTFADIGAFAWYLWALPWTVPGFDLETHRSHLGRLHERIGREGPLTVRLPAFWLRAVRPRDAPARA